MRDVKSRPSDAERFQALVQRFRTPLLRYFRRGVRVPEDAEDLTQEVFVRLLRRPDLDQVENIDGFLFVTAANLLKDYYRAQARHGGAKVTSIDNVEVETLEPNPGQTVEDRDEIGVLLGAIEDLPPKCRAVFVLFRFEDVPQAEIARRMGITVSMVEKHIAAALVALRKRLKAAAHDKSPRHD